MEAEVGENILDIAHENDIAMEGACGGECACSTCHVILSENLFSKLEEADEEEVVIASLAIFHTKSLTLATCTTNSIGRYVRFSFRTY